MGKGVFTLLGTGSSGGVPRVGGDWGVCDPAEPKNRRLRCSALVQSVGADGALTNVLIDTSPDLREQLLTEGIGHLDAILYTHDHADQSHGIDDVRPIFIRQRRPIPTYLSAETRSTLTDRFAYCFEGKGGYPSIMELQDELVPLKRITIKGAGGDIDFTPVDMEHGRIRCLGFRMGNLAYCNDVNGLPEETLEALRGIDTFVIDALRYTPHPSHANLEQALEWVARISPRLAVLTNMHVDMDYRTLCRELPAGVVPGHDGLKLDFIV
jgi:phosphoribosyl 1,2-cyclic phosphate phosphodiesterase